MAAKTRRVEDLVPRRQLVGTAYRLYRAGDRVKGTTLNAARKLVVLVSLVALSVFLFAGHAEAAFPVGPANDMMPSLGQFRIIVEPAYQSLMTGYPGYNSSTHKLVSPVMFDPATVIGRSAPHLDGSATDTGGTSVGTAGTMVSDSNFQVLPPGFQGPAGTREVHTEVRTMNLTGGGAAVRAGTAAPLRPISPGEVESKSSSGNPANDFPAESFFNVFVEVDIPALGIFPGATVYNSSALLVSNDNLTEFPPRLVYVHENSSAVPVVFKTTGPGPWQAGDLFGYLVLAGHAASYTNSPADTSEFQTIVNSLQEMAPPTPPPGGVGGLTSFPESSTGDSGQATFAERDKSSSRDAALIGTIGGTALIVVLATLWFRSRRRVRS